MDEMSSTTKEWERGAIAAKWLEFELAPMLDKIDLNVETARIANDAIEAHKSRQARARDALQMNSGARILPGRTAQITNRPQRTAFRIDRIYMTPEVARDFVFEDIRVGNRSQFQTAGPVPARAFLDYEPFIAFLPFETLQTAMDLVFTVRYVGNDEAGAEFVSIASGPATDTFGNLINREPALSESDMRRIVERMQAAANAALPEQQRLTEQQRTMLQQWQAHLYTADQQPNTRNAIDVDGDDRAAGPHEVVGGEPPGDQ